MDAKNSIINKNIVSSNIWGGIFIGSSSSKSNIISNNTIINNNEGISLYVGPVNNEIYDNIIADNKFAGIRLTGVKDNHVANNFIDNNSFGVVIHGCSVCGGGFNVSERNIIENNIISNHKGDGIAVIFLANNNYFLENEITNSRYSIAVLNQTFYPEGNTFLRNDLYDDVFDLVPSFSIYCVNGTGNHYYDGATGPTCPVLDQDNDGIPDEDDFCPSTTSEQIVYGCSCEQILELKPGNDENECSDGIIKVFTERRGWARGLLE